MKLTLAEMLIFFCLLIVQVDSSPFAGRLRGHFPQPKIHHAHLHRTSATSRCAQGDPCDDEIQTAEDVAEVEHKSEEIEKVADDAEDEAKDVKQEVDEVEAADETERAAKAEDEAAEEKVEHAKE